MHRSTPRGNVRLWLVWGGVALVALMAAAPAPPEAAESVRWPSYRGENAGGVAPGAGVPTEWSVESRRNLRWKTAIPGLGHSSPVIWGDRLFVTTAISGVEDPALKVGLYGDITPVEDGSVHRFIVVCLDRVTGEILWQRTAHEGVPRVKRHPKASHANPTPATDGKHVAAFFGSEGLFVYDMDGKLLWKKDLGVLDSGFFRVPAAQWGFGSSPVIHSGRLIVQCDVQKNSFIAAFDVKTGEELWRTARDEVPTWSTPTVVEHGGKKLVVANGYKQIGAYDLETGKPVWWLRGGGDIPVPTPVALGDLVFITSAHGSMAPIYAIRAAVAGGDITPRPGAKTKEPVVWRVERGGAYMQTPIVYGEHLYVCRDNGVMSVYVARTGEQLYQERLGAGSTGFTASAVAAGGKLYYTSEMGDIYVIKAGPEYKLLAENSLDEITMATPAIAGDALYFRTRGHVVAIGETGTAAAAVGTSGR